MDIFKIGAELFSTSVSKHLPDGANSLDLNTIIEGLKSLLSGSSGEMNPLELIGKFQSSDLASLVPSWIGDGENAPLSVEQITSFFSSDSVNSFASTLGIEPTVVADGLKDTIPEMINQASSAGALGDILKNVLGDSEEGADLLNLAKGMFS